MQEISFWNLISSSDIKKICIPTIQRDYAQGRKDQVSVRYNFLKALKLALDTNNVLTLDFIYGIDNDVMFIPLDGQQRLTTLWLLHWYVAYKTKKLDESNIKNVLLKFSYETRNSSTDFCKSLCSLTPIIENKSLRQWITEQMWYYHNYKQDPTISGMLNMISGTDIRDKEGNDMVDGLEEIFIDKECNYNDIWEKLTRTKCIKFNKLHVSLKNSDELYVKMNSRGKQLTDFENFKTELIDYVKNNGILDERESLTFAAKLDVDWTDIFWPKRWVDPNTGDISIDEIYFTFINRFVRLECIKKFGDKSPYIKQITSTFTSFEPYEKSLGSKSILEFIKIMDNLKGIEINTLSSWKESFAYIPCYLKCEKDNISKIENVQTLVFYGYLRYLLHGEYDEKSFQEWNRVLWNICENRVDKSNFEPTISLIDYIAEYSHNILQYLSKNEDIEFKQNKEQMLEEQRKARHLSEYPEILEMEGYAFFKGAIRFLYTDSNNNEDWDHLKTKCNNIKKLIPINEKRHTIRYLTPYIKENALSTIYLHWISNTDEDLRTILLDIKSVPYLHNFLLQNDVKYNSLLHSDIIELCETAFNRGYFSTYWKNDSKFIWTNYSRAQGYYKDNSYIIGNESYSRVLNIITISKSQVFEISGNQLKSKICNHIKGLYLNFTFKGHYFKMYGNNTICLMTNNWDDKYPNPDNSNGFYFSIDEVESEEDLTEQINSLIDKMKPSVD